MDRAEGILNDLIKTAEAGGSATAVHELTRLRSEYRQAKAGNATARVGGRPIRSRQLAQPFDSQPNDIDSD